MSQIYMENRGCMTRFLPATPELIEELSDESGIYPILRELVEEFGLSFDKIVMDPTRKVETAFYADYDHGLYTPLYLTTQYLQGSGRFNLMRLASEQREGVEALVNRKWSSYYRQHVPIGMTIYDFQRRVWEMEPEQVFSVWYEDIHKRIDYANGMWEEKVLDYVFSLAPPCDPPQAEANGKVLLYRGMGKLSTPPEKAFCWSSDPCSALVFAYRSGCGERLVLAEAAPEDIIFYDPSYYTENEVIVRPKALQNIRDEDMIPISKERFVQMATPVIDDYFLYGRQVLKLGYHTESKFEYHGANHILRVLMLTLIYCHHCGCPLSDADRDILIWFSLLHDCGHRTTEYEDELHGEASVRQIKQQNLRIRGLLMKRKDFYIGNLLIAYHCRDDLVGFQAINSDPKLSYKDKERALKLYRIAKDMDGLDRVRFKGLDYRMLRTPYARCLPLFAGYLLHEPMKEVLDRDFPCVPKR